MINQPRNTTSGGVTLRWNNSFSRVRNNDFDKAQKVVDSEVLKLCAPRVPFDKGILNQSGILNTIIGSGLVSYVTPYASKLYYSPGLNFQGAPLRGAFWFEKMKAVDKETIRREAGLKL